MTFFKSILYTVSTILISCGTSLAIAANEEAIIYKDQLGNNWIRWVIIDELEDRDLLMVVEAPENSLNDDSASQEVIEKRYYSLLKRSELTTRADYFRSLKDLKFRSIQFDRDRNALSTKNAKPLWPLKNSKWTLQDERSFSEWYLANVTEQYFKGEGIDFDCADFALLVRWAYAHDHGLPAMNTLSGSGKKFGHESGRSDWDRLSTHSSWRKSERFKAAARYLLSNTYTKSIVRDLYPIQIHRDYLTPGNVHLDIGPGSHHAQVINQVGLHEFCSTSECLTVLYGNLPARDIAYLDVPDLRGLKQGEGGFMRWRWPERIQGKWSLRDSKKMPGYSLEQYDQSNLNQSEFQEYISTKLNFYISPIDRAWSLALAMWGLLGYRIDVTAMGHFQCHLQYCDPQGTLYDDLSTPSKDRRFREKRDEFISLMKDIPESDPHRIRMESELKTPLFPGHSATIYDYLFNVRGVSDQMSADPSKSFLTRWGIDESVNNSVLFAPRIFISVWWSRVNDVRKAINACQPESGNLTCDPNSSEIKRLSTARIDQGFRNFKQKLDSDLISANPAVVDLAQNLSYGYYATEGCPNAKHGYCTAFDYLFDGKTYVEDMSSEPTDPERLRYGFK